MLGDKIMGPLIGAALRVGAKAISNKFGKKVAEEGVEELAKKVGSSVPSQAVRNASANKTNVADEMLKIEKQMAVKKDLSTAQANPARQKAVDEATTSVKEGVKTTEYPYVKPTAENMKHGGSVKKMVRGGGIESRGKTKGRFV
jgi:hypothetical protein